MKKCQRNAQSTIPNKTPIFILHYIITFIEYNIIYITYVYLNFKYSLLKSINKNVSLCLAYYLIVMCTYNISEYKILISYDFIHKLKNNIK